MVETTKKREQIGIGVNVIQEQESQRSLLSLPVVVALVDLSRSEVSSERAKAPAATAVLAGWCLPATNKPSAWQGYRPKFRHPMGVACVPVLSIKDLGNF